MGGHHFLEADFTIECWTPEHRALMYFFGFPSLAIYGIGIPAFALRLLFRARRDGPTRHDLDLGRPSAPRAGGPWPAARSPCARATEA